MEPQKPSIGRIVHYHASKDAPPEAAIVIAVHSSEVISVSKCNSGGTWGSAHSVAVEGSALVDGGCFWRWPPRA